jgi:flagellar biosynthesis chaperone FliJ
MPVSRALQRLLRVLELEEEQCQAALETATAEFRRLERAFEAAGAQERGGRRLIAASVLRDAVEDRLAGIEETCIALRSRQVLAPRIANAEADVADLREEYLSKRVERRQAETLVEEAQKQAELENNRRGQMSLDEWYLNRRPAGGPPGSSSKE